MSPADYEHADDSAYQLRALLRTLEGQARSLSETDSKSDHRLACNDIAILCELAALLCETVHDMMQMQQQAVAK